MPSQVHNGKAFEYAIARQLMEWVAATKPVQLVESPQLANCERCYNTCETKERMRFDRAAFLPIETLSRLEPGILNAKGSNDALFIRISQDGEGKGGDVRDVILFRKTPTGDISWEIGISAKNNNDAAKHSRISEKIHFGEKWLGMDTSSEYKTALHDVFGWIRSKKQSGVNKWKDMGGEKVSAVYEPLLDAFIAEMKRLFLADQKNTARNLIKYLIGRYPFYKVIKNDRDDISVLKVFNFVSGLGKSYNGVQPDCRPQAIPLPTRLVEFAFVDGGQRNTASLIMDKGWQVDFRIHNASTDLEESLKFDVTLEGNPPALFTQHLF